MFVSLVIHACGQFEILKSGLRNIKQRATLVVDNEQIKQGDSASDETDRKTSPDNQEEHDIFLEKLQQKMSIGLKDCVQHHQEILT
jgi:DNA-directed RNA polymerase specialized sigma subunit